MIRRKPPDSLARIETHFTAEERAYAWGQIGLAGGLRHLPEALAWYDKTGGTRCPRSSWPGGSRAALRVHDWSAVQRRLPPCRRRWRPAGLDLLAGPRAGRRRAGRRGPPLFQRIAGQPNFYGNLADEELGRGIVVPPRADAADARGTGRRRRAIPACGARWR